MSITLKLLKESFDLLWFELPEVVEYQGIKTNKFRTGTSLIRALNYNNQQLCDILVGKEMFCVDWKTAKISRKKIIVKKFASKIDRDKAINEKKQLSALSRSIRNCKKCGIQCKKSKKLRGCCSAQCAESINKEIGLAIAETHWCSSENKDEITNRRILTRKTNDMLFHRNYIPWNKGKTGIYSSETIEKIKAASQAQFLACKIKKTEIEEKVEKFLIEVNANFKYSFILQKRQYDFVIYDKKTIIEVQGDFWHGNPMFYGDGLKLLRDHQIAKRQDDKIKEQIAIDNDYKYVEFWEHDIHCNFDVVKNKIMEILNGSD